MPKPTFFNLPAEKRERIVELAIEEFSERPYGQASLSRIVARAGIAKGSMYQYFEDKLDLYRWLLLDEVRRRKLGYIEAAMAADATADFFGRLELMAHAAIAFTLDNPRLSQLSIAVAMPSGEPELEALHAEMTTIGRAMFTKMIQEAQAQGQVREDIDPALAAVLLIAAFGQGLLDVLLVRMGVDMRRYLLDPSLSERVPKEEQRALVHGVMEFIRTGLGAPPARATKKRRAT